MPSDCSLEKPEVDLAASRYLEVRSSQNITAVIKPVHIFKSNKEGKKSKYHVEWYCIYHMHIYIPYTTDIYPYICTVQMLRG